jgi:DNA invertase Pin-like site-specific DNA recombinase
MISAGMSIALIGQAGLEESGHRIARPVTLGLTCAFSKPAYGRCTLARRKESMLVHPGKFVAYFRVSTDRQGQSGLGLEAQRSAVSAYLNGGSWTMIAEFTEIESGKHADRPQLTAALVACKKHKAKLVIAKLDRLSRNLAFIATLTDSGVEFVAADNPHANKLTVHILAAVAQHEREMISQRTRDALQAAKTRGRRLGNPNLEGARQRALEANSAAADRFAANVQPIIEQIQKSGVGSLRGIARALAARGIKTARGGEWTARMVINVLERGAREIASAGIRR